MIAVFAMHSGLKKLKKVYKQVSAYVDLKKKNQNIFLALSGISIHYITGYFLNR